MLLIQNPEVPPYRNFQVYVEHRMPSLLRCTNLTEARRVISGRTTLHLSRDRNIWKFCSGSKHTVIKHSDEMGQGSRLFHFLDEMHYCYTWCLSKMKLMRTSKQDKLENMEKSTLQPLILSQWRNATHSNIWHIRI